jgi:hypothetical protein
MLKSWRQTVSSIEKCRGIKANYIIAPHYGQVPESYREAYWDLALAAVNRSRDFILEKMKKGMSYNEILKAYKAEFYVGPAVQNQPEEAFLANARNMIKNLLKEFKEYPHETN